MSAEQLERRRMTRRDLCEQACEGMPDEALTAGVVLEMAECLADVESLAGAAAVARELAVDSGATVGG